jgi:hypothetical protein
MGKFRNNNPGNMRYNPAFKGVTGKDSRGFAIFKTHYHGLRAMRILLQNYVKKGFNTIDKIINRYAPAADQNKPDIYAAFVSQKTGIARDTILKADQVEKLIPAMVQMETGKTVSAWDLSMARNLETLGTFIPGLALGLILFFAGLKK